MYTLIGHPLGHSMSPFIHQKLFELSGISEEYKLCDISPEMLETELPKVIAENNGLNVTIPHKMAVINAMDKLDDSAARYNSVNCIAKKDGKIIGYNTDCIGFLRSVSEKALGGRFLILGCGGVGRMMALESASRGGDITMAIADFARSDAEKLKAEIIEKFPGTKVNIILTSEISGDFDLLVNATPVGMYPKDNECLVSEEVISRCENVFDAIYNPNETVLVKTALKLGKTACGGMNMLVLQAAAAHEIWYGGKFSKEDIEKIVSEASEYVEKNFRQVK